MADVITNPLAWRLPCISPSVARVDRTANYGMDEPWVRCFPYEQRAKAGNNATLEVVITNHSPSRALPPVV